MTGSPQRLTRNQQLVHDCLARAGGARGAYDILEEVRDAGLKAPPQIYRALEALIARGLVHRVESLNAFVLCSHRHDDPLTAFAICRLCGGVTELAEQPLPRALNRWAAGSRFAIERTTLEVSGVCADCAGQPGARQGAGDQAAKPQPT